MSSANHAREVTDVAAALAVDPNRGLAAGEAVRRRIHFGPNVIHLGGGWRSWSDLALHFLRSSPPAIAYVLSDGEEMVVRAADLVPGDVIIVESGITVPADARILTATGLIVDERDLTGSSFSVTKSPSPVCETEPLPERRSMLYLGTQVVEGHGTAIVTAIGDATELAKIRK
ncbi:MAG TPA: cation-transporting P-type ATPase [Thermoanaerobaculia bacterium]